MNPEPVPHRGLRGWMDRNWRWVGAVSLPLIALHHLVRYWRYRAAGDERMASLVLLPTIAFAIFALSWPILLYCDWRLRQRRMK